MNIFLGIIHPFAVGNAYGLVIYEYKTELYVVKCVLVFHSVVYEC